MQLFTNNYNRSWAIISYNNIIITWILTDSYCMCPSDAMFCRERCVPIQKSVRFPPWQELTLKGEVEGNIVEDMLNTGCSQTLVRQLELVTEDKLTSRRASICCAHGGILQYPIADVQIRMGDMEFILSRQVCPIGYRDQFYWEQMYQHGESC